jgi:hypothetical protein
MGDVEVDCTQRWNPRDSERGVTHLGGPGGDRWLLTRLEVIYRINRGADTFFTSADTGDARVDVTVGGTAPNQFLQTGTDNQPATMLLDLPECPPTFAKHQYRK